MEKSTVTIEIRQEVSVTLLWIVAGVVLVSAAFLLAPRSSELWTALNYAGVAAALYMIALLLYALRKPLAPKHRLWMGIAAIVVIALTAFTWVRMESQVRWQAETLMRIRGVIGRGIIQNEVSNIMLRTLDEFYRNGPHATETLADVFRKQNPGTALGSNLHKYQGGDASLQIIVTKMDPGLIEVVSQETFVPGRDPYFKNYHGQLGMIQEKYVLTSRGMTHVNEN
jgi:hypothetical protein